MAVDILIAIIIALTIHLGIGIMQILLLSEIAEALSDDED